MYWLAQNLRKVKFRWNQVSLWQQYFKRNLFLNLYREGEKYITSLFPPATQERDKKCLTLAAYPYLLCLETPGQDPLRIKVLTLASVSHMHSLGGQAGRLDCLSPQGSSVSGSLCVNLDSPPSLRSGEPIHSHKDPIPLTLHVSMAPPC